MIPRYYTKSKGNKIRNYLFVHTFIKISKSKYLFHGTHQNVTGLIGAQYRVKFSNLIYSISKFIVLPFLT